MNNKEKEGEKWRSRKHRKKRTKDEETVIGIFSALQKEVN